ncbi:hypothetical protein G7054_g7296 [Neopestalotiopsis clavispora]|nr:hypothetical protein G7054_g7296 [Neopestalotiopsis clavispora]
MRSVVSNEKDALDILFEAAQDESGPHSLDPVDEEEDVSSSHASHFENTLEPGPTGSTAEGQPGFGPREHTSKDELLRVWNAYRFVAMSWLSVEEALIFVDAFFTMAQLSLVMDDFYADHVNHYHLVTREPFLCCMILMISSRYHTLPTAGGVARGYMLHQRFWDHCQHLLLRLLLGQKKNSKARIRTLGTIEALLLLVEWPPRSLHVPPAGDGWDSHILLSVKNVCDEKSVGVDGPSRGRWKEDVIKPAKRSDQMSWMVLGCVSSLMMEVALPAGDEDNNVHDYLQGPLADTLLVEYSSMRIYVNSLGLQAVVERAMINARDGSTDNPPQVNAADYVCIREVLDASLDILKTTIKFAESGILKFAPARLYLRFTTASVFLLKALGLGASTSRLQDSLSLLSHAIPAMETCKPDDVHLGARYATLLEAHTARLRQRFIPTAKPPFINQPPIVVDAAGDTIGRSSAEWQADLNATVGDLDPMLLAGADDSWLSLPIKLSLQLFILGDSPNPEWLHPNSLDYIWNMNP